MQRTSLPVPGDAPPLDPDAATAREALRQSVRSHGDAWRKYRRVDVGYDGDWGRIVERLQPVLVDAAFRKSSVERYEPRSGRVRQTHTGSSGTKEVDRRRPEVRVAFNGVAGTDREVLDAAARSKPRRTSGR